MDRPLDALMYRWNGDAILFCWPQVSRIPYYRWRGWTLLAREDEIRLADVEDTRQADEAKPINKPRWHR